MEEADPPRPVLVEWLDIALSRKTLVHPLAILSRLNRMASDGSIELASRIATLLPRAWDLDSEGATRLEQTLLSRESLVRCSLAGALDEIIHRRGAEALPLIDKLLSDESVDVIRIATSSLRLTTNLDSEGFATRCSRLIHLGDSGVSRQFAQTTLRDYMVMHPDDRKGLTVQLWIEGDEVVRSRLRELLLHMLEDYSASLSNILLEFLRWMETTPWKISGESWKFVLQKPPRPGAITLSRAPIYPNDGADAFNQTHDATPWTSPATPAIQWLRLSAFC